MISNNATHQAATPSEGVTVKVKPANGSQESLFVGLCIGAILLIAAGALLFFLPAPPAPALLAGDIASSQLSNGQKALLTELNTAAQDIQMWRQGEERWPSASELAQEWIAPFNQDASWRSRGGHQWQHLSRGDQQWYWSWPTVESTQSLAVTSMLLQVSPQGEWRVWFAKSQPYSTLSAMEQALIYAASTPDVTAQLKAAGWLRVINEDHRAH
ncbi:DUF6162 family protein [Motilimonas pumila]|uniref:Uncharacterized protein n=1 Tax=Motilimonas pumila TaxID=2303987 RepID=A0A418YEY8_9GAMM|nr:hypothetical protein [Motilimonas pumila]RJG47750.1 hypothetical protein D1Z90_10130 [Motilimonas pumila]